MSAASALFTTDALQLFLLDLLDCQSRRRTVSTLTFYRIKVAAFLRSKPAQEVTGLDAITSTHIKQEV